MSRKMLALLICCVFWGWSCAPKIPKAEYPVELEKEYRVSFETAWNALHQVVSQSRGTIIIEDQASGFLSYSLVDSKENKRLTCNVYVRRGGAQTLSVYFFSFYAGRRFSTEVEHDFYQKLNGLI